MPTSGALGAVYSAIGQSTIFSFRDARTPSRNRDQRAACVLAALPNHRAIPCLPSDFAFARRASHFSALRNLCTSFACELVVGSVPRPPRILARVIHHHDRCGQFHHRQNKKRGGCTRHCIISPTHARMEGRAPMWGFEFSTNAALLQGHSEVFAQGLRVHEL